MFKKLIPIILLGAILAMSSGCTPSHGKINYTLKPVMDKTGTVVTYEVNVKNSKDYESLKLKIVKDADGSLELTLDEVGVSASNPVSAALEGQAALIDILGRTVVPLLPIPVVP